MNLKNTLVAFLLFFSIGLFAQDKNQEADLNAFLLAKKFKPISMQKLITGHLYTEAIVNGVKGRFLIDTGAGATVIEIKRKELFKMKGVDSKDKATGAGGTGLAVQESINNKFSIGEYVFGSDTLRMMNLDHVNVALKGIGVQEIDGVIGADILTAGMAVIDYKNLILYLK